MSLRCLLAAVACAGCSSPEGAPSTPDAIVPDVGDAKNEVDAAPPAPGLRAEYFADYVDLVLERVEPTLDQDFGTGGPAGVDHFSARWTGSIVAPKTGRYTIAAITDDGVRVHVGGKRVIDDWTGHFAKRNEALVDLVAGQPTPLRVDYFEYDMAASARLLWSAEGLAEQVIPRESLLAAPGKSGTPGPVPPYTNPVLARDCPDPGVVATGGAYFMVCTGGSFPIRRSRDLVRWSETGISILPAGKPAWAANGNRNWAPEIHEVGGKYVAYYTTVNGADVLSIGAAHATGIDGPWTDLGKPLVEHPDGVIDATFFQDDDGSRWLFYKIDGNAHGRPTPILVQRLAADGLSFTSQPTQVLVNDAATWEGGVVEAPWVVKRAGTYYLFYSGNVYDYRYKTGVARASKIDGPYVKHGAPILTNNPSWVGAGHGSVVRAGEADAFVYHAWVNDGAGRNGAGRYVLLDRIVWRDGWPTIQEGSPSSTSVLWPGDL